MYGATSLENFTFIRIGLSKMMPKAELRMVSGSNDRIQLEALIAHFAHEGRKAK